MARPLSASVGQWPVCKIASNYIINMAVTSRVGFEIAIYLRCSVTWVDGLSTLDIRTKGGDFRGFIRNRGRINAKLFGETKALGKSGERMKHALKQAVVIPPAA